MKNVAQNEGERPRAPTTPTLDNDSGGALPWPFQPVASVCALGSAVRRRRVRRGGAVAAPSARGVEAGLVNAEGLVVEARRCLDALIVGHTLVRGAASGSAVGLDEDAAVVDFFDKASELASTLQCFASYFADIREAAGNLSELASGEDPEGLEASTPAAEE